MRLIQHLHDHRKPDQPIRQTRHPGTVAGMQGIGEIATTPGEGLNPGLDLRDRIEVSRLHGIELKRMRQHRLHALPPSRRRSATVFATLSRM